MACLTQTWRVGYRCAWPANPPQIVVASEPGSEIGGQPVLSSDFYADAMVYHQADTGQPFRQKPWPRRGQPMA